MNKTDQFSNVQIAGFMSHLTFLFCPWTSGIFDAEIRQTNNGFYFEKLFNMNTFYVREHILLIFYLNEMWDCIIKDMAQSKKTKKNRVVKKQSSDNVFLLFKRKVFFICSKK